MAKLALRNVVDNEGVSWIGVRPKIYRISAVTVTFPVLPTGSTSSRTSFSTNFPALLSIFSIDHVTRCALVCVDVVLTKKKTDNGHDHRVSFRPRRRDREEKQARLLMLLLSEWAVHNVTRVLYKLNLLVANHITKIVPVFIVLSCCNLATNMERFSNVRLWVVKAVWHLERLVFLHECYLLMQVRVISV